MATSDFKTFINLVNLCLGAGVLSLPWSFAGASIGGGLIIVALGTVWAAATNVVMVSFADRTQQFILGKLMAELPGGHVWSVLANIILFSCNTLCLIGYLVIFANNVQKVVLEGMLDLDLSSNSWVQPLLVVLGCAIVFPLTFLDQSRLAFTSTISVAANWYICVALIGEAVVAEESARVCLLGWGIGDLTLLAVVMMAVAIQGCILPLYQEMENRSLRNFVKIQVAAVIAAFILLGGVAVAGYVLYGANVASNVLIALPKDPAALLAQASILPVVIGVYPLILYPMTMTLQDFQGGQFAQKIRDSLSKKEQLEGLPGRQVQERLLENTSEHASNGNYSADLRCMIPLSMVIITGFVAATGIDLGPINNWAGIFSLAQTVVMPAALWSRMLELDGERSIGLYLHAGVGGSLWVLTLFFTGNHLDSITRNCALWYPHDA